MNHLDAEDDSRWVRSEEMTAPMTMLGTYFQWHGWRRTCRNCGNAWRENDDRMLPKHRDPERCACCSHPEARMV